MQRTVVIGLLGLLAATPVGAQIGSAQDSLKGLQALRVDVEMARNPSAARNGVNPDYVQDTVERRLEHVDLELAQGGENEDEAYLSVEVSPARVTDGFAVSVRMRLFQPATLANGETVMAATWHAGSFDVSDAETLKEDVGLVLRNHVDRLGADYDAANQ